MIYVPNLENYQCVTFYNNQTIRAYETTPTYNSDINYTDYYINSRYLGFDGVQHFSNYSTLPTCLSSSALTSNFYYRNDFDSILIIFTILFLFIIYFPIKIFSRFFGRWLKI